MNKTTTMEWIKECIRKLYREDPNIHMNVSMTQPKVQLSGSHAKIVGVYPHIFKIEEYESGTPKQHTFPYTDLMTGRVEIVELGSASLELV